MGGKLIETGQYDHHIWMYYVWLSTMMDAKSYKELRQ